MSLSNENVVTRRPASEPAIVRAKPTSGWLDSINPFASKPEQSDRDIGVPERATAPAAVPQMNVAPDAEPADESSGWFDFSFKKLFIIILILLFLGFNVLKMSGQGLESIKGVFQTLFGSLGLDIAETIKRTVDLSATGSKEIIDVTQKTADAAVDDTEELLSGKSEKDKDQERAKEKDKKDNENLAKALDQASKKHKEHDVVPDDAGSTVQQSKGAGKAGWCYVGEDRGFRSCVRVGRNDDCVSGDIFPTSEICVNPSLRE